MSNRKTTLWQQDEKASFVSSTWYGEYRGTAVKFIRTTDEGIWPGFNRMGEKDATRTWWDGYVAVGIISPFELAYEVIAPQYRTRREAVVRVEQYIDDMIEKVENASRTA